MKQIIAFLLVALLLTGCVGQTPTETVGTTVATAPTEITAPVGTTAPAETTAPQETTAPVDPGTYIAGSPIEVATDGAVRAFDPGLRDYVEIYAMGEKLLLISGYQSTTLTVLSGKNMAVAAQKELDDRTVLMIPTVRVNENGIAFHDSADDSIVFLDTELQETNRLLLPEDRIGSLAITPDQRTVYFCTADGIYALDTETGITRTVREQSAVFQSIDDVCFGGTVLACYAQIEEDDNGQTTYLSAETGETMYSDREAIQLMTEQEKYVACIQEGSIELWLTGERNQQPQVLQLPQNSYIRSGILGERVVFAETGETVEKLNCLNITTGKIEGTVSLQPEQWFSSLTHDGEHIWVTVYDGETECEYLYGWELAKSQSSDTTNYLHPYYTESNPDVEGLDQCKMQAQQLGEQYGVDILIWEDPLSYEPWDYTMVSEHQVAAYQRDLEKLERMLAAFPEGFMETLASGTSNGRMTICLVRSLLGDPMLGSLDDAVGIQYWLHESAYIALAMGTTFEQIFYHELSHVMENRIISTTYAFDFWEDLNPEGFEYDYDYIANASREDYEYLGETGGQDRAFIDMYSMSFPKEDRARIFEYAMMPYNEYFFESEIMQNKLRAVCLGIREAFELYSETPYAWEQYLAEPIVFEG